MSQKAMKPTTRSTDVGVEGTQQLGHRMKSRQLVMMGLGCAIGTGLFVGTGKAIATSGPAILLVYGIASLLVILIMWMLGEMAAADPSSGSVSVFAEKALGRTTGATLGWLWWGQMTVSVAAEATASAALLSSLVPALSPWLLALLFTVSFTAINLLRVKNFGELEYWFAMLKVAAIAVFLIVGIAILCGLIPGVESPGLGNLIAHGGFTPTGFAGIAGGLLLVVFSFGGMEIVTIAAAESENPVKNVSSAIRSALVRIIVFYLGSVFIMVTVLPWDTEELGDSPFVAVLEVAHLPAVNTVMTLVIVAALLSGLNANLYASSRLIFSLAERGRAPKVLARVSKSHVPRFAVLASAAFGFIAVVFNYIWPETVLVALLNIVGSTTVILWSIICISQIVLRRRAERDQVRLPLRMWAFPYLSYLTLALMAVVVILICFNAEARSQLIMTVVATAAIALLCRFSIGRPRLGQTRATNSNESSLERGGAGNADGVR